MSVTLDNNYFVEDTFNSVTFKCFGSKRLIKGFEQPAFVVLRPNFVGKKCRVEMPNGIKLPPKSGLDQCDVSILKMIPDDDRSIGHAIKPTTSGQVRKNEDGTLMLSTGAKPGRVAGMSLPVLGGLPIAFSLR